MEGMGRERTKKDYNILEVFNEKEWNYVNYCFLWYG